MFFKLFFLFTGDTGSAGSATFDVLTARRLHRRRLWRVGLMRRPL